jgi:hypothetical protein
LVHCVVTSNQTLQAIQEAELKRAAEAEREAQRLLQQSHYKPLTMGTPVAKSVRGIAGPRLLQRPSQMRETGCSDSDEAGVGRGVDTLSDSHADSCKLAELAYGCAEEILLDNRGLPADILSDTRAQDEKETAARSQMATEPRAADALPCDAGVRQNVTEDEEESLKREAEVIFDEEAKRRERLHRQKEMQASSFGQS